MNNEIKRECKYYGKCGACQTLNLSYERELSLKMKKEITLLGRFGHIEEIIAMDDPTGYRNKVQYLFDWNGGRVNFGLYRSSDGHIVRVDTCIAEDPEASSVCRTVRRMIDKYKLTVYDGRRGLIRHVMARKAFATGEILCAIVTSRERFTNADDFAADLVSRCPNVRSVSHIINDTKTPLFMDGEERILFGDGTIIDRLCGCCFEISAKSFYQINPIQTEKLYRTAIELAALNSQDNILDAYCGIGTVGIIAAKNSGCSLTGFDINSDAVINAQKNAKLNGIENARFICSKDLSFTERGEHFSVIFVDPPRAGCEKKFLDFIISQEPEKVVYISCNPETLARDLGILRVKYKVKKIQPVDMFPGTTHCETVVFLSRQKGGS